MHPATYAAFIDELIKLGGMRPPQMPNVAALNMKAQQKATKSVGKMMKSTMKAQGKQPPPAYIPAIKRAAPPPAPPGHTSTLQL
jgi:hypothetical protein